MIEKFVTFKEPTVIEDRFEDGVLVRKGGIIFRSHVVMTDGRHCLISDAQHGSGIYTTDETLVFLCDENGDIADWTEIGGGRVMRTDEVIAEMNRS